MSGAIICRGIRYPIVFVGWEPSSLAPRFAEGSNHGVAPGSNKLRSRMELFVGPGKEHNAILQFIKFPSFSKIGSAGFLSLLAVSSAFAASITFTDVSPQAWFATSIQQAVDAGIASGYKDSN